MELSDVRRANLRQLFTQHGGPKALAEKLNYRNPSFMTQMAGPNPSRPVSERTARAIEHALSLAPGTLDRPAAPVAPAAGLEAQYMRVDAAARTAGVTLRPEKFAQVLAYVSAQPGISDEDLVRLVRLAA